MVNLKKMIHYTNNSTTWVYDTSRKKFSYHRKFVTTKNPEKIVTDF